MTRRMTLIVLALVGSMVLIVTISPPDSGVRKDAEPTPTPAPLATGLSDPDAFDVSEKLSTAPGAEAKTVKAEVGDTVEITVDGPGIDSVALGDLSMEDLEPDTPAVFQLLADTPGTYPLVLVNEGRQIGALEVS